MEMGGSCKEIAGELRTCGPMMSITRSITSPGIRRRPP